MAERRICRRERGEGDDDDAAKANDGDDVEVVMRRNGKVDFAARGAVLHARQVLVARAIMERTAAEVDIFMVNDGRW